MVVGFEGEPLLGRDCSAVVGEDGGFAEGFADGFAGGLGEFAGELGLGELGGD